MLKIYIARHGQDEDNVNGVLNGHRDKPLTQKGIEQANEAAQKIKNAGLQFDFVYASPLQRAYKTAEIVSDTVSAPTPEIEPLLIERRLGVMSGVELAKIEQMHKPKILKTSIATYFLEAEGAETWPELRARAHSLLEKLKSNHKDGNLLLVTHGDLGKMLYAAYYDKGWEESLKQFHFGNSELLILSEDTGSEDAHVFTIDQFNH